MTFDATIRTELFDDLFAPVDAVVEEARVWLDDDGVRVGAVDPASVARVDAHLATDAFGAYDPGGFVGVDVGGLRAMLDRFDGDDPIGVALDAAGHLRLDDGVLDATLGLLDPETIRDPDEVEGLDLPAGATLAGATLDRAVRAAGLVGSHVEVAVAPGAGGGSGGGEDPTLRLAASETSETDAVSFDLGADDLVAGPETVAAGTVESAISLDYLGDVVRAIDADAEVALAVGDGMPIELAWSFADGDGDVTVTIAPWIPR